MLEQIAKLKAELEEQIGEPLSSDEMAYFEQISSPDDLKNYGTGVDENLAYDAGIAMGLSDEEANRIVLNTEVQGYDKLEAEYKSLVSSANALDGLQYEAEYRVVEEISAEGFASQKTRERLADITRQLNEARAKLIDFKGKHSSFMTLYRNNEQVEREMKRDEMLGEYWSN